MCGFLARRAYSVIVFAALFCTLIVKFFHSWRTDLVNEYLSWILADISVLLGIEIILSIICFHWPRRWIIRTALVIAAIVWIWSVTNAGWLIRTGTQILPTVLLQLVQDPLISLNMVGVNLAKMPTVAIMLHGPGIIALPFFLFIIAKPLAPHYKRQRFVIRIVISTIIIAAALFGNLIERRGSPQISSAGLRYNCQLKAITNLVLSDYGPLPNPKRRIPFFNQLKVTLKSEQLNRNMVVVVLDGVQYRHTLLGNEGSSLMPYLSTLAGQGVEYTNARSSVAHTTKALFAFLTGRYPSVSHDIAETVPIAEPYASIATILKSQLNFRTAFFQSAKGSFESRPGLAYNIGFDKFWARDDLNDTKSFLGYLACDEFSMLKPITEWIKASEQPFFVTILCSVTHDPYEVPEWFAIPDKRLADRYQQAICYTDTFLAALDAELAKLNLVDNTILCVIGDHGEAFGEHGMLGHQRIPFDEVLRIPWVMRIPYLIKPGTKITEPVSSVDVAPTLLALLGFETKKADFDGINVLGHIPDNRKVFFSGWMWIDPAGFVKGSHKFIYDPTNKTVSAYDLSADPLEFKRIDVPDREVHKIAQEIIMWRKNSVFQIQQRRTGQEILFEHWLCRWTNRFSYTKYINSNH